MTKLTTLPFDDLPEPRPELANAAPIPEREDGAMCGTCVHLRALRLGNVYFKCGLVLDGRADCKAVIQGDTRARRRKSTPACGSYRKKETPI